MGTVTRLTNKKRLALIEQRIIRETRKKDPDGVFYDPSPLYDEVLRQIKEDERDKKRRPLNQKEQPYDARTKNTHQD